MNFAKPMKGREEFGDRSVSIRNISRLTLRHEAEAAKLAADINEMFDIIDSADHAAWSARLMRSGISLGDNESKPDFALRWNESARTFSQAVVDWNSANLQLEADDGRLQWCESMYPLHMALGEVAFSKRPGFITDYQRADVQCVVLTVEIKWMLEGENEPRFNRVGFRFVRWQGNDHWMLSAVAFSRDTDDAPYLLPPF